MAVVLGGGAGTRLFPLTKRRAKPAVSCFLHRYDVYKYVPMYHAGNAMSYCFPYVIGTDRWGIPAYRCANEQLHQ